MKLFFYKLFHYYKMFFIILYLSTNKNIVHISQQHVTATSSHITHRHHTSHAHITTAAHTTFRKTVDKNKRVVVRTFINNLKKHWTSILRHSQKS